MYSLRNIQEDMLPGAAQAKIPVFCSLRFWNAANNRMSVATDCSSDHDSSFGKVQIKESIEKDEIHHYTT